MENGVNKLHNQYVIIISTTTASAAAAATATATATGTVIVIATVSLSSSPWFGILAERGLEPIMTDLLFIVIDSLTTAFTTYVLLTNPIVSTQVNAALSW